LDAESPQVIFRCKYGNESIVESQQWEEHDGRCKPVEKVLKQLHPDPVRFESLDVNVGDVELGHRHERVVGRVEVFRIEDRVDPFGQRQVGEPEHCVDEEVEKVLDQQLGNAFRHEGRAVDVGDVELGHVAEKSFFEVGYGCQDGIS